MIVLYPNSCYNEYVIKGQYIMNNAGLYPAILGKGPWPKMGKNDH